MLRQIRLVTWMNLLGLRARAMSSMVVVVGIAGVVGVLISVLAMSNGLRDMLLETGGGNRVMVLREGANFVSASFLPTNEVQVILTTEGIATLPTGQPAASVEVVTSSNLKRKQDDSKADTTIRGLDVTRLGIRPEIKLVEGRLFEPGLREVIIGDMARREYKNAEIGDRVQLQGGEWEIVGVFTSGDSHESGMLADVTTLMSAFERTSANTIVMVLEDGMTAQAFEDLLKDKTRLLLSVVTEEDYYERAAGNISQLLFVVTNVVAGIMALGALFGALNTMYSAVSNRRVEIATLRALGFGSMPVVVSVLVEAVFLAAGGAVVGAGLAWLFFSGNLVSIDGVVFELAVTPAMLGTGMSWAVSVGFIGGLFPAVRAARLPVVSALRAM